MTKQAAPRRALADNSTTPRDLPGAPQHGVAELTPTGDYMTHRQILVIMGGLMAGMFLAALDQSIVGVTLPKITSELGGLGKLS